LSDFVKFQQDFVKIERMKYLQYAVVAYDGTGNRDRARAGVAGRAMHGSLVARRKVSYRAEKCRAFKLPHSQQSHAMTY
jgi:hypothetical protein